MFLRNLIHLKELSVNYKCFFAVNKMTKSHSLTVKKCRDDMVMKFLFLRLRLLCQCRKDLSHFLFGMLQSVSLISNLVIVKQSGLKLFRFLFQLKCCKSVILREAEHDTKNLLFVSLQTQNIKRENLNITILICSVLA